VRACKVPLSARCGAFVLYQIVLGIAFEELFVGVATAREVAAIVGGVQV
jgi:hypothetical protein